MYLPSHFEQRDVAELHALMRDHPLATLVTTAAGGLTADAIPLEFDATAQVLRGHVARANPLWQHANGQAVLAIFNGPQAYVSPSWYPSKAATHKVVPTWNYTVVHARGTLRAVDDAPWVRALVSQLTTRHESGRAAPWSVADASVDYLQQMLRAIVGIEIAVTQLIGKWKVSQNRSEPDRTGVADGLQAEPGEQARAMAALVRGDRH
jgi:transcriptional regulator